MQNGTTTHPKREAAQQVTNPDNRKASAINFVLAHQYYVNSLDYDDIENRNLISLCCGSSVRNTLDTVKYHLKKILPFFREKSGKFTRMITVEVNESAEAKVLPTGCVPHAVGERYDRELDILAAKCSSWR
ncbi:hypothetical protein FBUS_05473 [Fasciolopsis buskii]|uniref:Uncharacterized protein n=1 Tax=Fasciolopsis buskii TaxID=27845 RepID=A0A8E0VM44_9TREM|nr:hypothetical protein FBUS_05473 [Fasciolopsis buski]